MVFSDSGLSKSFFLQLFFSIFLLLFLNNVCKTLRNWDDSAIFFRRKIFQDTIK